MRIVLRFFIVIKQLIEKLFNNFYNSLVLNKERVQLSGDLKIRGRLYLKNKGHISFGTNVRINSSLSSNPIGGDNRAILIATSSGNIDIGNNVGFSNIAIVSTKKIKICDNVLIGGGVKIYDTDFHSLDYKQRLDREKEIAVSKDVLINENAFIGAHSIILKGSKIGKCSIIGAGSVVCGNIPDGEIWAGNPARFIKKVPISDKL